MIYKKGKDERMSYKYPKICNYLSYEQEDEKRVKVTDHITEEVYVFDVEEVRYIIMLDGKTNPYCIETYLSNVEIDALIEKLDEYGLLKESRLMTSGGTTTLTLTEFVWTPGKKAFAKLCNNILIVSWLPIFVIGIIVFAKNFFGIEFRYEWLGYIIGLLSGMLFHELGHAFAGASYGAGVYELGVLVMYYLMPGAYVILDEKTVKNRLKRVQIMAAGIETNILLTGVFLILSVVFPALGGMFLVAAVQNVFLAFLNMTFIKGLDGMRVMSELLGIEDMVEKSMNVVFSRKRKRRIKEKGLQGRATVAVCYIVSAFQIALPVLFIANILEVIICIV